MPIRLPRWPFLALWILLVAGLRVLDTHQPDAWPDAAAPWLMQVRAIAPSTLVLDRVNGFTGLTPDLPVGSIVVLLALSGCTLATLLAIEVPAVLAIAVTLGLAATRSIWSTVSPGHDALPVAVVACAVMAVAWPSRRRIVATVVAVSVLSLSPVSAWLAAPTAVMLAATRRRRWLAAAALIVISLVIQVVLLRQAWRAIGCLAPGAWASALSDVLRPGTTADASPWLALRQALAVLSGDVHAFGLAVAALGLGTVTERTRLLRRASLLALALAGTTVATGLLPPSLGAALLLPWWAASFGAGLVAVVGGRGHWRPLAIALGVVAAVATPLLRHATVVPSPWVAGMPGVMRAVSDTWRGGVVTSADGALTRRLRLAGAATVPADAETLDRCIASGARVHALGNTVTHVEHLGYRIDERPLRAPMAAVLGDLRADQLVALALAPTAASWAGPEGLATLERLSVTRDLLLRVPAVAAVARTERGAEVRTGREGIDIAFGIGDIVAGQPMLTPVSVSAHDGDAAVSSAADRLATGHAAALAVFDRAHDVALRAVGQAAPGLPIPLMRHAAWRQATIGGSAACQPAARRWTSLPSGGRRYGVPVTGASPAGPVLIYLGSAERPQVGVTGLPVHPLWPAWSADAFDTRVPTDVVRLRALEAQDDVPAAMRLRAPWVARVVLAPRGVWDADRAAVSAGVAADAWIVRLAADGRRPATTAVCRMAAAGDRVLQGQYGGMDDESVRELAVAAGDGWHAAERLHGEVFQWTARPVATATFRVDAPVPLTLAMDAAGARASSGPQPITVRLNGRVLRPDWQGAARIAMPPDAVRSGENTLSLEVAQVVHPPRETRTLGVLVRQFRVIGPEQTP